MPDMKPCTAPPPCSQRHSPSSKLVKSSGRGVLSGFGVEDVVSSTAVCRIEAVVVVAWAAVDVVTGSALVVALLVELVGGGRAGGRGQFWHLNLPD